MPWGALERGCLPDYRKLPTTLRVAVDSSPLEGVGRVEDTFNLLAHAARKVVSCAAGLLEWADEHVCRQTHSPARGVEHQVRARHRLERCRREDRGDDDQSRANSRLAARVDRTPP